MALYQDQYLDQGSTFNTQINLSDNNGIPYNLTGFIVSAQAKKSYYTPNVAINFTSTIVNANTGTISLSANNIQTSNVYGTLVYDVILTELSSNNVTRVLEGKIYVNPGVTGLSGTGF